MSRLTNAIISENVASPFLLYQAVDKIGNGFVFSISLANKQMSENNAISDGVILAIALSDHCRCVSNPKCARVSSKVTSMLQRRTNQLIICSGANCKSVLKNASASFLPGSMTSTQRIDKDFSPDEYQRCVPDSMRTLFFSPPYQLISISCHGCAMSLD